MLTRRHRVPFLEYLTRDWNPHQIICEHSTHEANGLVTRWERKIYLMSINILVYAKLIGCFTAYQPFFGSFNAELNLCVCVQFSKISKISFRIPLFISIYQFIYHFNIHLIILKMYFKDWLLIKQQNKRKLFRISSKSIWIIESVKLLSPSTTVDLRVLANKTWLLTLQSLRNTISPLDTFLYHNQLDFF